MPDQVDVAPEVVGRQADLDELLLLHEDRVGHVVDDVGAEDGRGEVRVRLLGGDVGYLAVEDEVGARGAERDRHLAPEHRVGEHVAELSGQASSDADGAPLRDCGT